MWCSLPKALLDENAGLLGDCACGFTPNKGEAGDPNPCPSVCAMFPNIIVFWLARPSNVFDCCCPRAPSETEN